MNLYSEQERYFPGPEDEADRKEPKEDFDEYDDRLQMPEDVTPEKEND